MSLIDNAAAIRAPISPHPYRGLRHFQTLIATEDRLYVAADGSIYAFRF